MTDWKQINPPKRYTNAELLMMGKRTLAHRRVRQALDNGTLAKTDRCQVCDRQCDTWSHHWNGYDSPFDVWWVCPRCNANIPWHDGSHTLEEVRRYIQNKFGIKPPFFHRRIFICDVCDNESKIGRFVPIGVGESLYLCQYCYENVVGL